MLNPGDVVAGRYRVERVLGQGGMGMVVAARHLELDDLCALKVMLPAALGDASAVDRFLREARLTAKLKTEHVVKVLDVGRLPSGEPFLAMEMLVGKDLSAMLDARKRLPIGEAALYIDGLHRLRITGPAAFKRAGSVRIHLSKAPHDFVVRYMSDQPVRQLDVSVGLRDAPPTPLRTGLSSRSCG